MTLRAPPGPVVHTGVDRTADGCAPPDALRAAIATCGGSCWCDVDHAGGFVALHSPVARSG